MSRADELRVYEQYNSFGNWCRFVLESDARAEIEELEAQVAELKADLSDARKATGADQQSGLAIDEAIGDSLKRARSEVPEWCLEAWRALVSYHAEGCLAPSTELVRRYEHQLRACGIEVP